MLEFISIIAQTGLLALSLDLLSTLLGWGLIGAGIGAVLILIARRGELADWRLQHLSRWRRLRVTGWTLIAIGVFGWLGTYLAFN